MNGQDAVVTDHLKDVVLCKGFLDCRKRRLKKDCIFLGTAHFLSGGINAIKPVKRRQGWHNSKESCTSCMH